MLTLPVARVDFQDAVAEFWSHSWRGEAWQKIATLSLLKNGTAAAIIGTLAACLGSALSFYGVLPLFGYLVDNQVFLSLESLETPRNGVFTVAAE